MTDDTFSWPAVVLALVGLRRVYANCKAGDVMRVARVAVAIVFIASSVVGPAIAPGNAHASGAPDGTDQSWVPSTPTY